MGMKKGKHSLFSIIIASVAGSVAILMRSGLLFPKKTKRWLFFRCRPSHESRMPVFRTMQNIFRLLAFVNNMAR